MSFMCPIIYAIGFKRNNNSKECIAPEDFKNKLIQICHNHRKSNRALVFAIIIYDYSTPNISKILQDEDYWNALNKISSNKISIFCIYRNKSSKKNDDPIVLEKEIADKYFHKEITSPSIVFFQIDKEKVIDTLHVQITEETQERGYIEIKNYISWAVNSISKVTNDNKENYQEIFNLLSSEIESKQSIKTLGLRTKRIISITSFLTKLFSAI